MAPQNITFADFQKGLLNSGQNAFDFPEGGLKEGQNLDLADGGLKTRPGSSISSTGSLPDGEIMALTQFRSPTTEQSYLVAQMRYEEGIHSWTAGTTGPSARFGHSAVWDEGNGRMLLFAGQIHTDSVFGSLVNDLWSYDPLQTHGPNFPPLVGHP